MRRFERTGKKIPLITTCCETINIIGRGNGRVINTVTNRVENELISTRRRDDKPVPDR